MSINATKMKTSSICDIVSKISASSWFKSENDLVINEYILTLIMSIRFKGKLTEIVEPLFPTFQIDN